MTTIDTARDELSRRHIEFGLAAYRRDGFHGSIPLLAKSQVRLLVNHFDLGTVVRPLTWSKGRAANDRLVYDIASHPSLVGILRHVLGENIILWGARTVERHPGQVHEWHVDIESAVSGYRFASIWIGLHNTSRESGLAFISRSHQFAKTIQEVQWDKRLDPGDATDEMALDWATRFDPQSALCRPDVDDGEALIFDGRIWHGSLNRRDTGTRLALLLQYAETNAPVFMPDPSSFKWPFKLITGERPPVIVVRGEGNGGRNRQVSPPPTTPKDAIRLRSEIWSLSSLSAAPKSGWRPHPLFHGLTEIHDFISCHASVLSPGKIPHMPHAHIEEEILLVLDGEADLLIGDSPAIERARVHRVGPGMFVYYPPYVHHTLRNAGSTSLTYLMFKWRGAPNDAEVTLTAQLVDSATGAPKRRKPWRTWLLMEGETNFLGKLHAHYSEMQPGVGYEPHRDAYDVAVVVLSGSIETLQREVKAPGVVFYAADEPHGLRCISKEPARYLVFEFHARPGGLGRRAKVRGTIAKGRKPLLKRVGKLLMAPIRHFTKLR